MTDRIITETELIEALKRMRYSDFTSPSHAKQLVDDVIAHREQEWKYGDIVRSARGRYYRRAHGGGWQRFGESTLVVDALPTRPLTFIGNQYDTPNA